MWEGRGRLLPHAPTERVLLSLMEGLLRLIVVKRWLQINFSLGRLISWRKGEGNKNGRKKKRNRNARGKREVKEGRKTVSSETVCVWAILFKLNENVCTPGTEPNKEPGDCFISSC